MVGNRNLRASRLPSMFASVPNKSPAMLLLFIVVVHAFNSSQMPKAWAFVPAAGLRGSGFGGGTCPSSLPPGGSGFGAASCRGRPHGGIIQPGARSPTFRGGNIGGPLSSSSSSSMHLSPLMGDAGAVEGLSSAAASTLAAVGATGDSSSLLLSAGVTFEKLSESAKTIFIVLLFGGGLIPATIAANKSMIGTITGSRAGGDNRGKGNYDPKKSLDPFVAKGQPTSLYVSRSDATGPSLPLGSLLFAADEIPLVDVVAVVGRIDGVDSIADWRDLPSAKLPNLVNPDKPPMWLPRSAFKTSIRNARFVGWPVDPKTGMPVGGEELRAAEEGRVGRKGASIGDAALDAVFDTWATGASIATPDKVAGQLGRWRPDAETFSLPGFVASAVAGRSVTGLAILTFIVIQVVAYGSLFIAPALRVFFDIDIGFGHLGACDAEGCTRLFDGVSW